MKFCQPHWDQLKGEIEKKGMGNLGARTGQGAVERIKAEIEGTATDETFDPLMAAHNEILFRFMEPLGPDGLYVMMGEYCPCCELDRLNPGRDLPTNWINGITDDLRKYCESKGMIPPLN
jgi:hypothetical protein